jgi:DNA polymerase III subunit alpha
MNAVALTDHGVMYGIAEFYKKAVKEGIKPIIGMEAYIVSEGSRFEKGKADEASGRKKNKHYNHLILSLKIKKGIKILLSFQHLDTPKVFIINQELILNY